MSAVFPGPSATSADSAAPTLRRELPAAASRVAETAGLSASDRLAASRSALRVAMLEIVHPPKREPLMGGLGGDLVQELLAKVRSLPGAAIVIESVEHWWKEHPLHTASSLVGSASSAFVKPLARRSPQTLILGAAAAGALFALTRPWRWLLRPALFVGLLPQLVSQAMKHMPVESWVRMAGSLVQPRAAKAPASPARGDRPAKTARTTI